MIVSLAFAAGRANSPWAGPAFWVGQAVMYAVPAAILLARRPITLREGSGIAWLMPLATYVVTVAYSPTEFRFLDEFLTVRTAQSILTTHHLFHVNPSLLVSPQYPGIEIVTTAISSLAHLSIFTSGIIVVGLAHVLLGLGIYYLILEVTHRPRVAALAVLVYSTGPHFQFFDSYFIYEALALPLMVACLLAVVRMNRIGGDWRSRLGWAGVATAFAAATVVTHHVTSYALFGFLLALELAQLLRNREARRDWLLPSFICMTAGMIALWDLKVATQTITYFTPTIVSLVAALPWVAAAHHGISSSATPPTGPVFDLVLEYASVLLLYALVAMGVWRIWRSRLTTLSSSSAFALASISLVVALGLRGLGSSGSQYYGRASSYFMIPAGLATAFAIMKFRIPEALKRPSRTWRVIGGWWRWTGVAAIVLLGVGGIAGGWPPYYALLPGGYRVDAWERSVDEHALDLALWARRELPPNYGVASDFVTSNLLASVGHEAAPSGVAKLFLTPRFEKSARTIVSHEKIDFIAVDDRWSQELPADGSYFANDPNADHYRSPIPPRDLDKFNQIAGVSRIFDDGKLVVYALAGSLYRTSGKAKS
jgi:hypothetical protein